MSHFLHSAILAVLVSIPAICLSQVTTRSSLNSEAIIADGHNDMFHAVLRGFTWDQPQPTGSADLPRFLDAGIDIQVFSLYAYPVHGQEDKAWGQLLEQMDSLEAAVARHPSRLSVPRSPRDLLNLPRNHHLLAIPALEGCFGLKGNLDRLAVLAHRGLRICGITWNENNAFGTSAANEGKEPGPQGLTAKGRLLVRMLDSLGILIDASHLGSASLQDVLAMTRNPIIASHSNCRALRDHSRNLTDEEIRAIAARDGVIMVTFVPGFLASGGEAMINKMRPYQRELDGLRPRSGAYSKETLMQMEEVIRRADAQGLITVTTLLRHIAHLARVASPRHIGIGSDFGALDQTPVGLSDIRDFSLLIRALERAGYSKTEVEGILGKNFIRVLTAVWSTGSQAK